MDIKAGEKQGNNESVVASENVNSTVSGFTKIKTSAIEQPGAGDKLAGTRDVRGEPVKASSTRDHPNTIAAKAYLPFGRYKVDKWLLVECAQ